MHVSYVICMECIKLLNNCRVLISVTPCAHIVRFRVVGLFYYGKAVKTAKSIRTHYGRTLISRFDEIYTS